MILIYNVTRILIYPLILLLSFFNKKIRNVIFNSLKNRKSIENSSKSKILIHVSSVGELNLCDELINKLIEKKEEIIISVMTSTGMSELTKRYKNNKNINSIYFPLDDYCSLKKIFKKNKISKVIVIETEIWPNLFYLSNKYSKLYIVNGRLTEKGLNKYLKIKYFISKILSYASKIMVQSEEDKKRYLKIKQFKNISVYSNLKYTINYNLLDENQKNEYYEKTLYKDRQLIVCGSTRETEERFWINIYNKLVRNYKSYKWQLVIVPRHLERVDKIIAELKIANCNEYSLFTENKKSNIIIVDKMGILRDFYELSDHVFVGGTIANIGGHSILEPLFYGKKPIIGPNYKNIEDIVNDFKDKKMVNIIREEEAIYAIINNINENERDYRSIIKEEFKNKNEINKIIDELYD